MKRPKLPAAGLAQGDRERLALIDELRARGARLVEINGDSIRVAWDGPPRPEPEPLEPAARKEAEARAKAARSLDSRLFDPLGIRKSEDADA